MPSPAVRVRPASFVDVAIIGQVLAAAFAADPLVGWLFELPGPRLRRLPGFFSHVTRREYLPRGIVHVAEVDGVAAGAALWLPPGRSQPSTWQELAMIPGFLRAMGRRVVAGAALERGSAAARPAVPHWYLGYFGTRPEYQGRGVGSALLRHQFQRVDRDRQPAYLESSSPANVPLYEHFGFGVHGTIELPEDAPVLTPMLRPTIAPAAADAAP